MLLINFLIFICSLISTSLYGCCPQQGYILGIEVLARDKQKVAEHGPIAVVTNQSGKDKRGRRTIDILLAHKFNLRQILVPEHGLDGTIPAGQPVPQSVDKATGIPIYSLYEHDKGKIIEKKLIEPVDTIIFDLQDSGMRHFTYISTLYTLLEAATKYNKKIIVLDRPNPLADVIEGPLVDNDCRSFFSILPIPLRHGMTIGELALYFNKYFLNSACNLQVIQMERYNRSKGLGNILYQPISPNIRTIASCLGYSFLGLIGEISPFDVGLHDKKPFQVCMMPEKVTGLSRKDWQKLASLLQPYGITTKLIRSFNAQHKMIYTGLSITIDDIAQTHSFQAFLTIIEYMHTIGIPITIKSAGTKALGTHKLSLVLDKKMPRQQFINDINKDLETFYAKARSCFLYKPWPRIIKSI